MYYSTWGITYLVYNTLELYVSCIVHGVLPCIFQESSSSSSEVLKYSNEIAELKLTIEAMLAREKSLQKRIKELEALLKKAEDDARETDAKHVVCSIPGVSVNF